MNSLIALILTTFVPLTSADDLQTQLSKIKLPAGFKIEILTRIENPRAMAMSPSGTLFVGNKDQDKVYAITRTKLKPLKTYVLAEDLDQPLGVAYQDGALYFSSTSKVLKIKDVEKNLEKPVVETVSSALPDEGHHGGRFIAFGPDKKLYIGVGAPCNVCDRGSKYANITRMNADGTQMEVFAEGIRNTVGFDWHPKSKALWFTENGRDLLGDDVPPCELNFASKAGLHFGFPYCHAGNLLDPDFGKGKKCEDYIKPAQNMMAHVAPLGMRFYTGKMFPKNFQNQIFVTEHGSWNRSKKSGYRVMLATLDGEKVVSYAPFAEGWLQGQSAWGRPADVLVDQDGALLISDDKAGAIYRVSYP